MSYSGLEAVMLANRAALLRFLLARSGSGGDAEDLPGLPHGQPDQPQPAADRAARHPHRLGMEPVTGDRDDEFGIDAGRAQRQRDRQAVRDPVDLVVVERGGSRFAATLTCVGGDPAETRRHRLGERGMAEREGAVYFP